MAMISSSRRLGLASLALALLGSACEPAKVIEDLIGQFGPPPTTAPPTAPPTTTPSTGTSTTTPSTSTPSTPSTSTTTSSTSTTVPPGPSTSGPVESSACERSDQGGPAAPPAGAVRIDPGQSAATVTAAFGAGTVFWFAPGRHAVTTPITVNTHDIFVGAPGAVLDGQFTNPTAFTGGGSGATIRNLVIERFGTSGGLGSVNASPINRSVAPGWTLFDNTIRLNDGNAVFAGPGSTIRNNCIADNGQTGISAPAQRRDGAYVSLGGITIADNEIAGNNRADLESSGACSGCTGGMKLWQTIGAVVTGNDVHDNHGVGIWLDNNNVDARIESNLVRSNDKEGIMVETSYNSVVARNVLTGNAVAAGSKRRDGFPLAAIFISNSGGAAGLAGPVGIDVRDNVLTDNYNGVVVFVDANRSCASTSDSSIGHCTLTGGTQSLCADGLASVGSAEAFIAACHWNARLVTVTSNRFVATPTFAVVCGTLCNRNATIATSASPTVNVRLTNGTTASIPNPAPPTWAQSSVASPAVNRFGANTYSGPWTFNVGTTATNRSLTEWRASGQDG